MVRTQAWGTGTLPTSGRWWPTSCRRAVPDPRRRPPQLVRGQPPRRRRRAAPARRRPRTTAGGRSVPVQLQRVHGVDVRGVQGLVRSVNTNYRYTADELLYLWDNADAGAVVFHGSFADTIDVIRDRLPKVRLWLWVDDAGGACRTGRRPTGRRHERFAAGRAAWGRSGDDLELPLHRRHHGHAEGCHVAPGRPGGQAHRHCSLTAYRGRHARRGPRHADRSPVHDSSPRCPQMHGTGNFPGLGTLSGGGSIVTLTGRNFDAAEVLDAIEREGVTSSRSSATRSRSRSSARSTRSPAAGISPRSSASSRPA